MCFSFYCNPLWCHIIKRWFALWEKKPSPCFSIYAFASVLHWLQHVYHLLQSVRSVCSSQLLCMSPGEVAVCHACPVNQRWLRRAGMIRREAVLSLVMRRVTWSKVSPATASPFTCRISSPMPRRPTYGPSPLPSPTFSTYTPAQRRKKRREERWIERNELEVNVSLGS